MTQSRWKSKAAWAALAAFFGLVLQSFGLYRWIGITGEVWQALVNALLAALVAFGILNNPTDAEHF